MTTLVNISASIFHILLWSLEDWVLFILALDSDYLPHNLK